MKRKKEKLPNKETYLNRALKHQSIVFIFAQLGVPVEIAGKKQSGTKGNADVYVVGTIASLNWFILQCDLGGLGGIVL